MSTTTALILAQAAGRIQFRVDEVTPAAAPLATAPLGAGLEALLGGPPLASSHPADTALVAVGGLEQLASSGQIHPLAAAVHLAFSQHRPLTLGPDAVWLTIAQGFAQHVTLRHEELRDRLVRHDGRRPLVVTQDSLQSAADWAGAVAAWADQIAAEVGPGLARALTCDFSTTTPAARTASQLALMDALRRYFDYRVMTICGIPTVTLLGTPDDWRRIRERVEVLAEYELGWWAACLRPIADGLLATAEGRPPLAFWQQIYCPREVYGGNVVTGWLTDLFPYINDWVSRTPTRQNPLLKTPVVERGARDGLDLESFPCGLSQVWCHISDLPGGSTRTALLAGGLLGVRQADDGALSAEIGWAVCGADPFTALLDRLAEAAPRAEPLIWERRWSVPESFSREAIQILDTFHGQTLYAGTPSPWRVHEPDALVSCDLPEIRRSAALLLDLIDGRGVGVYERHKAGHAWETLVVVGWPLVERDQWGREEHAFAAGETRVIAIGLAQFVERMLASGGRYYFDEPGFVPDASLTA